MVIKVKYVCELLGSRSLALAIKKAVGPAGQVEQMGARTQKVQDGMYRITVYHPDVRQNVSKAVAKFAKKKGAIAQTITWKEVEI